MLIHMRVSAVGRDCQKPDLRFGKLLFGEIGKGGKSVITQEGHRLLAVNTWCAQKGSSFFFTSISFFGLELW